MSSVVTSDRVFSLEGSTWYKGCLGTEVPLSTAPSHPGCHLQSPGELNQQPHLEENLHKTSSSRSLSLLFFFSPIFIIIANAVQVNTADNDICKHCQRHNGPRVLTLYLELSLKVEMKTSCRDYSRYGVNSLGPLCLWQCLNMKS